MSLALKKRYLMSLVQSGGVSPRLPSAYQEVEYIESSGTQYINTLVNAGTNITAQIKFTSSIDGLFFLYRGDRNYQANSGQWRLFVANVGAQGDFVVWDLNTANINGTGRCSAKTSNLGTPFEIEIGNMYIKDLKTNQYHNNEWSNNYNPTTQASFTSNVPIYLFCGTPLGWSGSYGKCYYLKMYDNGTLIRHFIPCYRIADGEIGLYDLVNDVFYTNQGSGAFTKGGNI